MSNNVRSVDGGLVVAHTNKNNSNQGQQHKLNVNKSCWLGLAFGVDVCWKLDEYCPQMD